MPVDVDAPPGADAHVEASTHVGADVPTPELLKALAEPRRWRILELLAREELCVCHLAEEVGVAQPLVSHHLRVLRGAGLVDAEKHRQWTYYRLRPEALEALGRRFGAISSTCPPRGQRRRPCE